jgi:DNA mismatch repair protein MutS
MPAALHSILFPPSAARAAAADSAVPEFFRDLHLDQIVAAVTAGKEAYDLAPFFHGCPIDPDTIPYRQGVMRDLDSDPAAAAVDGFAGHMRAMLRHRERAQKSHYDRERQRWFLDAVLTYCGAVERLQRDLHGLEIRSAGLGGFRDVLDGYVAGARFAGLAAEARRIHADLSAIRYGLIIRGSTITVRPYAGEIDYSAAVERTFEKFRRGAVKDYRVRFGERDWLDHVDAAILDRVALLYPDVFAALDRFCAQHADFVDETIAAFDREVQFYRAYLQYLAPLRAAGLPFCLPEIGEDKAIRARDAFDLALAAALVSEGSSVVTNDVVLRGRERIVVVTGPNQGGKTTFARMVGQLHYLGALGCLVPGTAARLFRCDHLFTHFERQEDIATLRGKLEDDLLRMHAILAAATPRSLIIINEIFASTTLEDATDLSRRVFAHISRLDALAVCVTFLDELASFDAKTVSIVGTVDPRDPAIRTYKLERRPADGMAHALAIAEKYRVTFEWLQRRIPA